MSHRDPLFVQSCNGMTYMLPNSRSLMVLAVPRLRLRQSLSPPDSPCKEYQCQRDATSTSTLAA